MPDQMPRQLAQIQDFSARAGEKVLDILGKQNPTSTIISDLIDRATRAYDSDQMAKAAALQESMRALGYNPDKIRGALAGAGFRDGIVGSKELQDRYEEANQAQIAKTTLDNTLRVQGLKEQGSALAADFTNFIRTVGKENAHMWIEDHQKQLKANPYAYNDVMSLVTAGDISLTPYISSSENVKLTLSSPEAVETSMNNARKVLQQAQNMGIDTSLSAEEAIKLKDQDAWIANQAKLLNYDKDGSRFSDFQENMRKDYAALKNAVPNASPEAILHAMKINMDNGGWINGIWRVDQENVNREAAISWLEKHSANWQTHYNNAFKAKKILEQLEKDYKENTPQQLAAALATKKKAIEALLARGDINVSRARDMMNKVITQINTLNSNTQQAIDETLQLGQQYPAYNIKNLK